METAALVAPITALELFQDRFLLAGEGPVLSVYRLQPRPKVGSSLGVLHHYRIHGIRPKSQDAILTKSSTVIIHGQQEKGETQPAELGFYDFAVFGGKAVRLVRLHLDFQDVETLHLEVVGSLLELQDWALDVRWLPADRQSLLCVAVAHNAVLLLDSTTGNALVQCSCLEGCLLYSALLLVHESWRDTVLVGGTVFQQLVIWKPGGDDMAGCGHKAPVERRLLGHSGVIFSISYLQEKGYLASASDDRSIRVWDVGALGGPGGKCGDLNPICLRVLYGHQARVFSVRLSAGYAYSAGEDGACLVWDVVGGGKVIRTLKGHRAGGVRSLAVGRGTGGDETWVATGGADGGVRLWKVEEEKEGLEGRVTDLKFPGPGLPKVVSIAGEEQNMCWSQCLVCTDRGAVCQYRDGRWTTLWEGPSEFYSYCVMETVTTFVTNIGSTVTLCAVANISGSIQVFSTSDPLAGMRLTGRPGKIHSIFWKKGKDQLYLLASGAEGFVCRWYVEVKTKENSVLVLNVVPLPPFLLPLCSKRWLTAAICFQHSSNKVLWVCGDRRGSLLLFEENIEFNRSDDEEVNEGLQMGRKNRIMEDSTLQPLSCLFGVHGKHGVTSVFEYRGLFYSTGKDGCVRVFRVSGIQPGENESDLNLEVLRVQRACRGMEWLERVFILESEIPENLGEDCKNVIGSELREARFVIAGFHAVHFVIWDPVRQERLMVVPCGGGHRSWSLWPSHTGVWAGCGALVFIKQGAVLTSQHPGEMLGSAGKDGGTGGWSLREGIHGRGIWCVSRLGRIEEIRNDSQTSKINTKMYWEIVVTGGEDTSLAVLAINPVSGVNKVLSVITDHISGVRTVTAVTQPRGNALSALLLSAGGRAQIQCNRLLVVWDRQRLTPSCQVVQVASHRLDLQWEKKRNRHKTVKMDPESRYMSIEVLEEKMGCILAAVSSSDGALRLFSLNEAKGQIDMLWETFYHQRCVLCVASCSLQDGKGNRFKLLFSTATDGRIAVWHLTESLLISADNSSGATAPPVPCLVIPAHQSGVNSLAVWVEKMGQEDGCLVTVASGGDDGQLTVSTVRVQYPENGKVGDDGGLIQICRSKTSLETHDQFPNQLQLHLLSQHSFPFAHAASLTALKLLSPGLLVSTSSDQRVCLWRVSGTDISHSGALCSHVADAAALAVWEEEGEEKIGFETKQVNTVGKEMVGPVLKTSYLKEEETDDPSNPLQDGDTITGFCECSEKKMKVGWILVCGQGFQLLRLGNAGMDTEIWKNKREKENERVRVTFQK
ncbi:PREDICTED: WD repeat-containing protein 6 [Cyprinodon variegatus]|uniref:WD repeat-containing protein 6 n=1 Tax=Cyprinodon variegatus TaxID=28743 RepID=UPI000742A69E|nr:PREDICTED: WD repeat-containing protein 6 [Cyprinodon variegatus]